MSKIGLIGYPGFFYSKSEDENFAYLNDIFWQYIFNFNQSSKLLKTSSLSEKDLDDIYFVKTRLLLSFNILTILGKKELGIEVIIYAFNIINSYLNVLNKCTCGITLRLFHYTHVSDQSYTDYKETIFYKFFISQGENFFKKISENDTLEFVIEFSDQLFQVFVIDRILRDIYGMDIKIKFLIGSLVEFENKISLKERIQSLFGPVEIITDKKPLSLRKRIVFGKEYKNTLFFNGACSWRKCTFCNIGKYSNEVIPLSERDSSTIEKLKDIKKSGVEYLNVLDPSITKKELLFLCEKIIHLGVKVKIHLRTKFTPDYTDTDLDILGKAGVTFMGIGLESVSPRLNRLMQKYEKDYTEEDFEALLYKASKYGIKIHYYTIFGFPTELKEEIVATRDFLLRNIENLPFFSCTPGFFGLNKGSYVYEHPEEFGVKFVETFLEGVFIQDYQEENFLRNLELIKETKRLLLSKLFLGNIQHKVKIEDFWNFIEHTSMFHIQQMSYQSNPYRAYFSKNSSILEKDRSLCFFEKSGFIQSYRKGEKYFMKNMVTLFEFSPSEEIYNFFRFFDSGRTLGENSANIHVDMVEISILIDNYFLIAIDSSISSPKYK